MSDTAGRRIRVCFIILKAYPLFNPKVESLFGGSEAEMYLVATELAKDKNFEVTFVVGDYGQDPFEVHRGVTVIKSVNVSRNLFLGAWRIWRAFLRANAQIYMSKAASLGTTLNAIFASCHRRIFVFRTGGSSLCDGTYLQEHPFRGKAFLWALRRANLVITQNQEDSANLLTTTAVSSEVVLNAHPLPASTPYARDTILWVGRSDPVKRPDLFLKLARSLPAQDFTMICQKASRDNHYDALVKNASLIENLHFIRRVPFHEIDAYFQRAKTFVNTSDSEGFPNTFLQAGKCATPILSFNVNPDGFLDKYKCGICAQKIWSKFIDGLKTLIVPEKMEEYGKNGRSYVEQNHDIKKIVQTYKTLFARLARRVRR